MLGLDDKLVSNYSGFVKPEDPKVTMVHGGGIEWTIKDGIPYHVPTLMKEVKDMVTKARAGAKSLGETVRRPSATAGSRKTSRRP